MASETLFDADLEGARGEAYRQVRENGGNAQYVNQDGDKRKVRYTKPVPSEEVFGDVVPGKFGYWYDAPMGGAGIRVEDGDSLG